MLTALQHIIPIALGFFAKLMAIKSQQAHDQNKLMLQALAAKSGELQKAREQSNNESPMAAWNRRVLMFVILALVAIYPIAGLLGVQTVVPVDIEPFKFLWFEFGGGTEIKVVDGLYKFDEIFTWATMIVEFYFGGQLAKGR
jgi:hypothetical protein|tara:strand:- start:1123 stop:1548 length:426 start_codon:yes stop_codon:yes gene_type:complete